MTTKHKAYLASFVCLGGTATLQAQEPEMRPNILFIVADDLGWRDTAVYGSTFYKSPNIDRLAAEGMRFTDAYAANPLCSPTRASILTGQYPMRNGLTTAAGHIPKILEHQERDTNSPEIRSAGPTALNYLDSAKHYALGKAMKEAGYATAFIGKWHMGCRKEHWPESHGFDYVKGGRHHPGPPGTNHKRKFYPPWDCDTLKPFPSDDTHVDDHITNLTIDYMKEQKEKGKPFFICHWPYSVHSPFQSKPELIEKWQKKVDPANPQHSYTMAAMIQVLDDNVGRLMKALKDNGLDENTIVIFTSDNGGNMYDTVDGTTPTHNFPLRSGKGNNYEGGVRIPLIVKWPGVTKPGSICESVVSTVDHYPAILEMTKQKLRPEQHKDGVSYVPVLRGEPFDRGPILCDMPHPVWATYNIPNTFVRDGDWKMYRFWYDRSTPRTPDGPSGLEHRYELYNIRNDIEETRDVSAKHPDRVKAMSGILDTYYKETGVLRYNPNKNYNNRTVGTWFAVEDNGNISAENGALVMQSDESGYAVGNHFFPNVRRNGYLIFEARSATKTSIKLAGPGKGRMLNLTETWQPFELSGQQVFLDRKGFAISLETAGKVEIRNARITSADKTEMMRFKFY